MILLTGIFWDYFFGLLQKVLLKQCASYLRYQNAANEFDAVIKPTNFAQSFPDTVPDSILLLDVGIKLKVVLVRDMLLLPWVED